MPAKGSPEWYRQRREGDPSEPPTPMRPIKDLLDEAVERLKGMCDERDAKQGSKPLEP